MAILQICPLDPIIGACRADADKNIIERIRGEVLAHDICNLQGEVSLKQTPD
jgi:hypothetical protein